MGLRKVDEDPIALSFELTVVGVGHMAEQGYVVGFGYVIGL